MSHCKWAEASGGDDELGIWNLSYLLYLRKKKYDPSSEPKWRGELKREIQNCFCVRNITLGDMAEGPSSK